MVLFGFASQSYGSHQLARAMKCLFDNSAIRNAAAKTDDELTHSQTYRKHCACATLESTLTPEIVSLTPSSARLISSAMSCGAYLEDTFREIIWARLSYPPHSQALKLDGLLLDFYKMIVGFNTLPLGDFPAYFVVGDKLIWLKQDAEFFDRRQS